MENKDKLKQVYDLYTFKKYKQANKINNEILATDPDNIYAKRYSILLEPFLQNTQTNNTKGKIAKVKGKNLTCPHCKSSIAMSSLNDEQKTKIRNSNYNNLELKCPYCHTIFTLQKKVSHSILGIKLGNTIKYNQKTYRTVGYIKYSGKWFEGIYSGLTSYLEWILLGDDNSYLYFSEGYSIDDGSKTEEFEFSNKINPKFSIVSKFNEGYIEIDGSKKRFSESCKIKAMSLYGENSKVFKIGENVELYSFNHKTLEYVIEKEGSGRQAEAGIYQVHNVTKREAANYFGKELKNNFSFNSSFVIPPIFQKLLLFVVIGPFFAFAIVQPIVNKTIEKKVKVPLETLDVGKKYEINFRDSSLIKEKAVRSVKYDYGGVKTYYEKNIGLKFSVESNDDKDIIKNIKNLDKTNNIGKIFSGDIYKLK